MDSVEHITWLQNITTKCKDLLHQCVDHLQQFPTTRLDVEKEGTALRNEWCDKYSLMNEEVASADKFSVSDLVFVTLCHVDIALNVGWRTIPSSDQQLSAVLEVVRFFGCQHTMDTSDAWPTADVLSHLQRCISWIVVHKLADRMPDVEPPNAAIIASLPSSRTMAQLKSSASSSSSSSSSSGVRLIPVRVPLSWMSDTMMARLDNLKQFGDSPKTSTGEALSTADAGQQLLTYWSEASVTGVFLPQTARIMQGLAFEEYLWNLYPHDDAIPVIPSLPELKIQFHEWIIQGCSVDSSDDFANDFRNAACDSCLPTNSRAYTASRRPGGSANVIALTQLQYELGFDVASKIVNSLGVRVRSIGYEATHRFYPLMVVLMFGYSMFHAQRVEFLKQYYIPQSELHLKSNEFGVATRFRRLREPYLVRLRRKWVLNYVQPGTQQIHWMECTDAIEACLCWLWIVKTNHENELISGHQIGKWSDQLLTVQEVDDFEMD
jgi:hypothetical protein